LDLRFEIKRIERIELSQYESLKKCVREYRIGSLDDAAEDQIMNHIEKSLGEGVWFVLKEGIVFGFIVLGIRLDQYGNQKCFVDYLYASKEAVGEAIKLANVGISWVKFMGINQIIFVTRRNSEAMAKFLPGGCVVDSTVMTLCV
jgi:hypothetical protein